MKRHSYLMLLIVFLSGCVTTKGPDLIQENYKSVVFNDGITLEEAIFIAKKEVKEKTLPETFVIDEPQVITEFESVPRHEDYWFVSFREIKGSTVPVVYMVVIQKENGKIVFSRSYLAENEWVLEAALLKLHEKQK